MKTKLSEAQNSLENEKRGTLGGHQIEVSPFSAASKSSRAAKSSVDYWKAKVRPRLLRDGKLTPELYVRLKEGSSARGARDAWVCLDTANRAPAAAAHPGRRAAAGVWLARNLFGERTVRRFGDPRDGHILRISDPLPVWRLLRLTSAKSRAAGARHRDGDVMRG